MTTEELFAFAAIWTAVCLPLGPNAVACLTAALSNAVGRALWVAVGITIASVVHALVAAFGFAALLFTYAGLFQIMKWLGVAYLGWIAISLWRRPVRGLAVEGRAPAGRIELLRRGFLVSMSNPKAVLVYMAVFTQAIDPGHSLTPQLAILLPTASGIVFLVYVGYVLLGAPLRRLLTSSAHHRFFNRTAAGFYLVTASAIALADPRRSPV